MKRIPTTFELNEDDIREAIEYWLNHEHSDESDFISYNISFSIENKESPPPGGHRGGMSDPIITQIVSARAEEDF